MIMTYLIPFTACLYFCASGRIGALYGIVLFLENMKIIKKGSQ